MDKPRIFKMAFADIYKAYIQKAERKGKASDDVDRIIFWLTGYDKACLARVIDHNVDMEAFYKDAPCINPNAALIKGVICGHRVEDIQDETMRNIRYLDKLIDELAKGRAMDKILRSAGTA